MNPAHFERVKQILLRVLELPEVERGGYLVEACGGDPQLRADVEELLAHDVEGGTGEGRPAGDPRLLEIEIPTGLETFSSSSRS